MSEDIFNADILVWFFVFFAIFIFLAIFLIYTNKHPPYQKIYYSPDTTLKKPMFDFTGGGYLPSPLSE
jgi:hypothetical protein